MKHLRSQSMCVQMEYKWNTEVVAHMHKMFHGAPLFNQGVFILGVHSMTKEDQY